MASVQPEEANRFDEPPTQDFTTAGLLMDLADRKVSLTLRDGNVIHGVLRSYDEFGSFVVQDAVETIYHKNKYAHRNLGVWIIKGESVALLGKINIDQEAALRDTLNSSWTEVCFDELEKERDADRQSLEDARNTEIQEGLTKGLVGSTLTQNPYRF